MKPKKEKPVFVKISGNTLEFPKPKDDFRDFAKDEKSLDDIYMHFGLVVELLKKGIDVKELKNMISKCGCQCTDSCLRSCQVGCKVEGCKNSCKTVCIRIGAI